MKYYRLYITAILALLCTAIGASLPVQAASSSANNFSIRKYEIEYRLSRDDDKRSVLHTKETITAQFPDSNQNHGLERSIPSSYDGHSTSLNIQSVTDENKKQREHTVKTDGPYKTIQIGNKNQYVHGEKTYVIEYSQRDVTKNFKTENHDEFYWDTNGTQWRVPIDHLSVSLTVDESLRDAFNNQMTCYKGAYHSTRRCAIVHQDTTFRTSAHSLARGESVTLALGFRNGTFAAFQKSFTQIVVEWWAIAQVILGVVMVGAIIWLSIWFYRQSNRLHEIGVIVPEYVPPKDTSVQVSARLLGSRQELTAQIIDFAVRHYIQIIETKEKKWYRPAEYTFKIIRPVDDLSSEEREVIEDIFRSTHIDAQVSTKELRRDTKLAKRLENNPLKLKKLIRGTYGIRQKNQQTSKRFTKIGWIFFVAAIVLLSPPLIIVAIVSFIMGVVLWVLTDKGLALLRYLKGLKMYISVAETDRLKMLQSPEGAQKVGFSQLNEGEVVKLYEKLLPYAILFGKETEWNKQLGLHYQASGAQPSWYTGMPGSTFNAAVFSSAMTDLSSSIQASGASSSTNSGSGGGGYAGGGGGGGGGGGW